LQRGHLPPPEPAAEHHDMTDPLFQRLGEKREMFAALGQHHRRTPLRHRPNHIFQNQAIPTRVHAEFIAHRMEGQRPVLLHQTDRSVKTRGPHLHNMRKGLDARQLAAVNPVPHRSALHENDGLVAVLADGCRGEADHVTRFRLADHTLECGRRYRVTFIDDHLSVCGNAVIHGVFPADTLHQRDIQTSGPRPASAADPADLFFRQVQKQRETGHPLCLQMLPVHQHQRIHAPLSDQPSRQDCFPERRAGGQHPGVVRQQRLARRHLLRPQFTVKRDLQRAPRFTPVMHIQPGTLRVAPRAQSVETPARQRQHAGRFFGASDNARFAVCRKPHSLRPIELGILKGGQLADTAQRARGQAASVKIQPITEHHTDLRRHGRRGVRVFRLRRHIPFPQPFRLILVLAHRQRGHDALTLVGDRHAGLDLGTKSQRGLSGTWRRTSTMAMPSTAPRPKARRQPRLSGKRAGSSR